MRFAELGDPGLDFGPALGKSLPDIGGDSGQLKAGDCSSAVADMDDVIAQRLAGSGHFILINLSGVPDRGNHLEFRQCPPRPRPQVPGRICGNEVGVYLGIKGAGRGVPEGSGHDVCSPSISPHGERVRLPGRESLKLAERKGGGGIMDGKKPGNESNFAYTSNALQQRVNVVQSGTAFADYGNSTHKIFSYDSRGELISAFQYLGSNPTDTTAPLGSRKFQYSFDNIGNRLTDNHTGLTSLQNTYIANSLNQYTSKTNNSLAVTGTAVQNSNVAVLAPGGTPTSASRQGKYWNSECTVANVLGPWYGEMSIFTAIPGGGPGGTDLARIDAKTAQIAQAQQTMTYDADGNLTNDGIWVYHWDGENRLTQMSLTSAAISAGYPNYLLTFTYDYLGRRVAKRVVNMGTGGEVTSRRYLYDGWNLVAEYTAPGGTAIGSIIRSYTWGLDIARSMTDAGGVGALVQIYDYASGNSYLPGYDGNGNVVMLANGASGALAAVYEYSPFGESLRCDKLDSIVGDQPFRFSTKFYDVETGLAYYGHRYYSPGLGRFINRDPIEEAGGLNLYAFCGNDGINKWDYLGMETVGPDIVGELPGSTPGTEYTFNGTPDSSWIANYVNYTWIVWTDPATNIQYCRPPPPDYSIFADMEDVGGDALFDAGSYMQGQSDALATFDNSISGTEDYTSDYESTLEANNQAQAAAAVAVDTTDDADQIFIDSTIAESQTQDTVDEAQGSDQIAPSDDNSGDDSTGVDEQDIADAGGSDASGTSPAGDPTVDQASTPAIADGSTAAPTAAPSTASTTGFAQPSNDDCMPTATRQVITAATGKDPGVLDNAIAAANGTPNQDWNQSGMWPTKTNQSSVMAANGAQLVVIGYH